MKFIAVIPARYASSRFPGKPLALLGGVPVIVRVCRRVAAAGVEAVVATDDDRIASCVRDYGFRAVLTSASHRSGTDRVCEACRNISSDADVVINVQGDEPFIAPSQLRELMGMFADRPATQIATLARPFDPEAGFEALFDPNVVKVVFGAGGRALYFSRSIIPYVRGVEWQQWLEATEFYTHVGIYAYRADVLREITQLPQSSLEKAESLEQLRWLQAGYDVRVGLTRERTVGIDTPADLAAAQAMIDSGEIAFE